MKKSYIKWGDCTDENFEFFYDVYVYEGNEKVYGKSCIDITMADDFAARFLNDTAFLGEIILVENIIKANEFFKDRNYVEGSVKYVKV